jgi:hypothetical protein
MEGASQSIKWRLLKLRQPAHDNVLSGVKAVYYSIFIKENSVVDQGN